VTGRALHRSFADGKSILVTGGAGFIGSALVRALIRNTGARVVNLDKLTYAANLRNVESVANSERYRLVKADICHSDAVTQTFRDCSPDLVFHLAAESHVDRSIAGPGAFLQSNVAGTFVMLEAALAHWRGLPEPRKEQFRFVHISTDEVFGSLGKDGHFREDSPYRPNSPYSASKAASDHFVRAWHHTYGLPVLISNCSNNYGPYQFPEKLIPLVIANAVDGLPLPVYAKGENVRDWLFVEDHADALCLVAERGRPGECYVIGGNSERRNIDVVRNICRILDERRPKANGQSHESAIIFVQDRPGHDLRYAIDASKARHELGFRPRVDFETGLVRTVEWYLANEDWWRPLMKRSAVGT
jgi:dTDP-glucose 4,6-dehydratase